MSKVTRKSIAVLATIMLLATTLMALTITPAAAASVGVALDYEVDGNTTTVTATLKNGGLVGAIEFHFDMAGKTFVSGTNLVPKGGAALSQVGFVEAEGVVKYLGLVSFTDATECYEADENGDVLLCSFKYTGGGEFSAPKFGGGVLGAGGKIDVVNFVTPSPTTAPPTTAPPTPTPTPKDTDGKKTPLQLTMIGTLVDCDDKPLSGIKVILLSEDGPQVAVTDREGKFVFICLDEGNYTLILQDKDGKEIARKGFKLEEGKDFAASVNSITVAHGCFTFAVKVTLDKNNNIIFGTPVACKDAPVVAKKPGGAPYTGPATNWILFGLVQLICAGAIVTLIARRRATN